MTDVSPSLEQNASLRDDLYAQIPIPPNHLMYHTLNQAAKQLMSLGQRSPAEYRRVMAGINTLVSKCSLSDGNTGNEIPVQAP